MGEGAQGERELWERYRGEQDPSALGALAHIYTPWAHAIARSIHRRIGAYQVDREDFAQNASIGLLEAIGRYDPARGVEFKAYAAQRVRGAVFNGLRQILSDRPSRHIEQRMQSRLAESDDLPDADPLDILLSGVTSLGIGYLLDESVREMVAVGSDHVAENFQRGEIQGRIIAALDRLPERARLIIENYYFRDIPFTEIAASLGVTKGRVSQIHKAAIEQLRDLLREYG
ncbi:sigma-70 family RNA polymerase sigma factor [Solilutibacter silvestris]|uniref:sigma-70 family RNA polymerase sigma factor n=1 Tax=Solilutibacter silvestris TaxID=1645665 RepID=UPI003D342300